MPYGTRLSQAIVPVTPTNGLASNAPDGLALKLSVELLGPEAHATRILQRELLKKLSDDPPSNSNCAETILSALHNSRAVHCILSLQEEFALQIILQTSTSV